ncbi:hypothetical protein [Bradyrhizobium sp. WSM2254]|uniref:hypothetical protein n=1 Tax=Bradyrhizobium sp. WSM2254 TaxID=1188263 RepID=UPI0004825A7B|nr:hypothetical protein [Bradyrhizobium sp. WSM2254]
MKGRAFWIGLLMACVIGACGDAAAAQPSAPPAGYSIDEEFTQKSPDGATIIEQYLNKETDDWKWQFWVRRQGTLTLLDPEPAGYPADFIFTNDLKWIVRVQKIGSGTLTLHLYGLDPQGGYSRASNKPLGDLAWDYLKTRPDWRKIVKEPEYHASAYLLEGLEQNYRKFGVDWPANRYILIGLSADADVKGRKPMQTGVVNGWHCRYDLQTGKFDVPAIFTRSNARAVLPR